MADINSFPFANPWPTLPELVPTNSDILFKYLASYHAVSTGQAKEIYPWMREGHAVKRSPFHQQAGGVTLVNPSNHHYGGGNQLMSSSESLASPISPQQTPPISLSPGKNLLLFSLLLFVS